VASENEKTSSPFFGKEGKIKNRDTIAKATASFIQKKAKNKPRDSVTG